MKKRNREMENELTSLRKEIEVLKTNQAFIIQILEYLLVKECQRIKLPLPENTSVRLATFERELASSFEWFKKHSQREYF